MFHAAAQQYQARNPDHVQEVLGGAALGSTQERKARQRQEKLAYGMELQQQARMQEEKKRRERNERLGIVDAPANHAPANFGPPPPMHQPMPPHPAPGPPFYGGGPPPPPAPPPPPNPWGSPSGAAPPFIPPWGSPPGYDLPPPPAPLPPPWAQPPGYGMPPPYAPPPPMYPGSYNAPPPPPPPPPFGGYGPPPGPPQPFHQGPEMGGPPSHPPPRGGGLAGMHMGGPGPDAKSEAQARKERYRMELEQQIQAKRDEERRRKEASLQEARNIRGIADFMGGGRGGGGGGAPYRDPAGHVITDLNEIHRLNQQRDQGLFGGPGGAGPGFPPMHGGGDPWGAPGGGMMGGMNGGGMNGFMGGMGGPPPPPFGGPGMGGFGGMGGGMMGEGPGSPGRGGMGMGGGMGMRPGADGPPFQQPVGKFRAGNPFATPGEMDAKQQQQMELQEALERQIAEKRMRKELEKQREQEEIMREENRLRADQEQLKQATEEERGGGKGKAGFKTKEEAVADAWKKAREEAEEEKRKQWAQRRASRSNVPTIAPPGSPPAMPTVHEEPPSPQAPAPHFSPPPHPPPVYQPPPPPPRPSTQQLSEQVKRMAQGELDKIRAELESQTASLRAVLEEQNQQLRTAKEHEVQMEEQAESAQAQLNKMRVDMIRGSLAVPESMMRILSDYEPPVKKEAPPSMLDIGLDLPPPAAALRRSLPPNPVFDMGPLIPDVHNPNTVDPSLQRAFLRTPGRSHSRPPTQGLRQLNPLEASLAAESMFIYPNGRELPKYSRPDMISQQAAAANNLPFRSLHLSEGLKGAADKLDKDQDLAAQPAAHEPHEELSTGLDGLPDGHVKDFESYSPTPRASLAADVGSDGRRIIGAGASAERLNSGPLPPGTADAMEKARRDLQNDANAAAFAAAAAGTPADVESLMQQNRDKLNMLKELAALGDAGNVERVDSFLKRFSNAHASLPERTHTPVLRVNTPMMPKRDALGSREGHPAMNSMASQSGHHASHPIPSFPFGFPHQSSMNHSHSQPSDPAAQHQQHHMPGHQPHDSHLPGQQGDAMNASASFTGHDHGAEGAHAGVQGVSDHGAGVGAEAEEGVGAAPRSESPEVGGKPGNRRRWGQQDQDQGQPPSRGSHAAQQDQEQEQQGRASGAQSMHASREDGGLGGAASVGQSVDQSYSSQRAPGSLGGMGPPPMSPSGPPEGLRKRPRGPKNNDIIFTDNNRPARASVDGDGAEAQSKPSTPVLGDYLNPESLARSHMLPGPGTSMPPRVPSAGRRAPSASGRPPPSSHSVNASTHSHHLGPTPGGLAAQGGGHYGQQSNPPSRLGSAQSRPRPPSQSGGAVPPAGGVGGLGAGAGAHLYSGPADSLDAEVGRMAHALPPSTASRPASGRERPPSGSLMASRTRRPSWASGGSRGGGGRAAAASAVAAQSGSVGGGPPADLEFMVLGGMGESVHAGSRGGSQRSSRLGSAGGTGGLDVEAGALSGMSIPGLPRSTSFASKRSNSANSTLNNTVGEEAGGGIVAGPPVGGVKAGEREE